MSDDTTATSPDSPPASKKRSPLKIAVPKKLVPLSLFVSFLLAFSLGRVSRKFFVAPGAAFSEDRLELLGNLPVPKIKEGIKIVESRIYNTSDYSCWIMAEETACEAPEKEQTEETESEAAHEGEATDAEVGESSEVSEAVEETEEDTEEEEDDDEEEASLGQQLMLDFKFVDKKFLASAEKLSKTMMTVLEENELDLLSYHCYKLHPEGVSCTFALLKGRASFTTWPKNGVLALDIFVIQHQDNLLSTSLLPSFEKAFNKAEQEKEPVDMHWILKQRGFEEGEASEGDILASGDMDHYPLGASATYKKHVASVKSMFQTINVFDILTDDRPLKDYQESLKDKTSYQGQNPELFEPDRLVFMGGLLQSRRLGDAAYHEALVHPGLFAHPNPKRVAIIGGGEGATLREILKHETIEQVVMIDIDKMIVEISKEYLPQWSDCSNLVGRADSCFEDDKARVYLEDAFKWFKDRFLEGGELAGSEEPFDVVIMDALDPQGLTDFVANLYTDKFFYESLYNGLTDDGILIAQLGSARSLDDPPEDHSVDRFRLKYIEGLANAGFKATREYVEGGCGFGLPWLFAISFKQRQGEYAWVASDAEMDVKIRTRATPTKDGKAPFHYFDSSSMRKYKYPPKTSALVHCRRTPLPKGCQTDTYIPAAGSVLSYFGYGSASSPKKIHVLPSHQETILANSNGKEWYKDVIKVYGEDHLRQVGHEYTYNPDADRRVLFE